VKIVIAALAAIVLCVGCESKPEATPAPAKSDKAADATKEAAKPATVPAAVAQAEADEDLPTVADFEDEAEKEIDNATVEAEVDKLAKEIGE
jgi:PBP1b-binding outer membrane lipoprotein LpoB